MIEDREVLIGVARYVLEAEGRACEFALVIADAWQGRGIGKHMMLKLISVARSRGVPQIYGEILSTNHGMLEMMRKLGFRLQRNAGDATIMRATLELARG
jgi:acetyltransferase